MRVVFLFRKLGGGWSIYGCQFVEAGKEFVEQFYEFLGIVGRRQLGEVYDVRKEDVVRGGMVIGVMFSMVYLILSLVFVFNLQVVRITVGGGFFLSFKVVRFWYFQGEFGVLMVILFFKGVCFLEFFVVYFCIQDEYIFFGRSTVFNFRVEWLGDFIDVIFLFGRYLYNDAVRLYSLKYVLVLVFVKKVVFVEGGLYCGDGFVFSFQGKTFKFYSVQLIL